MTAGAPLYDPPSLWLWRAGIILGWALILSGVGLFVWDCLMWLRDGSWPPESLADIWGHAPLGGDGSGSGWHDMRGVHYLLYKVLHWLGPFPISLALIVLGVAAAWISNGQHEKAEDRLAEARRGVRAR